MTLLEIGAIWHMKYLGWMIKRKRTLVWIFYD